VSKDSAPVIYVDGTDLLEHLAARADPLVASRDQSRSRHVLTQWLAHLCGVQDQDAVLVFDGNSPGEVLPPSEWHGRVHVVNLPPGAQAAGEIAGMANRSASERRTVVVSNDRLLTRLLARGGAQVLSCAAFLERVRKAVRPADRTVPDEPREKLDGVPEEQVDYWLDYFRDKQ
jgi:hypothetical protein